MPGYVYGPVPSRRLGASLGIDLVPRKTCSLNCVYCQLGPTPKTTLERKIYAPVDDVVAQVDRKIKEGPQPDYLTLGGSGEPTLHSRFGEIAGRLRERSDLPNCLLTNGTLFFLPEVRNDCDAIDLIIPSLDAGDEKTFQRVNRPDPDLSLDEIIEGLTALRREFDGTLWLEVFLVPDLNDSGAALENLRAAARRVDPDLIHLNTAVRPPAEESVRPLDRAALERIRDFFGEKTEIIARPEASENEDFGASSREEVYEMLERRPCTLDDICMGLNIHPNEAIKHIRRLQEDGKIRRNRKGALTYYQPSEKR